ncbi:hypothetical protein TNCV_2669981 [Trichonephila clavipes]|nr:hypothetical protein TNCV_2669981 [Trichonephila clavipes]
MAVITHGGKTEQEYSNLFQQLSDRHPIHLQWVPSSCRPVREQSSGRPCEGGNQRSVDPEDHMVLTSTEIYYRAKELICRT